MTVTVTLSLYEWMAVSAAAGFVLGCLVAVQAGHYRVRRRRRGSPLVPPSSDSHRVAVSPRPTDESRADRIRAGYDVLGAALDDDVALEQ